MTELDYRRIFEYMPSAHLVLSRALRIVAANEVLLRTTSMTREQLVGRDVFDAFPGNPDDPSGRADQIGRASLERVIRTGVVETVAVRKHDSVTEDGSYEARYWSSIHAPVPDADGDVVHVIIRTEDVTDFVRARESDSEHRRVTALQRHVHEMEADLFARAQDLQQVNDSLRIANEQLMASGDELRRQQRAKDQFIATLSHELRNPLAAIQGALDNMDDDRPSGDEMLDVAHRQTDKLTRMVADLLDTSRAIVGKLHLEVEVVDVRDIVNDVLHEYRGPIERESRRITISVPEDPAWVCGDSVRLCQAVGNILDNAFKFTDDDDQISVILTAADGRVLIEVSDSGIGFEPTMGPFLFEPFSQADRSLDRRSGGLGLGLAIVRTIAAAHGGSVSCSSDGPGTGASFTMMLPVGDPPSPTEEPAASGGQLRSLRILLVEDNVDVATGYAQILQGLGHVVHVEHSGMPALATALRDPPDVVICDIGLPDLNGYELARLLHEEDRLSGTRLIAMSGYGQEEDRSRSSAVGFERHLVKPVPKPTFIEALAALAEG